MKLAAVRKPLTLAQRGRERAYAISRPPNLSVEELTSLSMIQLRQGLGYACHIAFVPYQQILRSV